MSTQFSTFRERFSHLKRFLFAARPAFSVFFEKMLDIPLESRHTLPTSMIFKRKLCRGKNRFWGSRKGKHLLGIAAAGEKEQIGLSQKACDLFQMPPANTLLIFGNEQTDILVSRPKAIRQVANRVFSAMERKTEHQDKSGKEEQSRRAHSSRLFYSSSSARSNQMVAISIASAMDFFSVLGSSKREFPFSSIFLSGKWQARKWPGSTSVSGGGTRLHLSQAM